MQSVSYVDCHNLAYYSDLAVLCVMCYAECLELAQCKR